MSKYEERIPGPTPNGGDYAIAQFHKEDGTPCEKAEAKRIEVTEYDAAGAVVGRTYGIVGGSAA